MFVFLESIDFQMYYPLIELSYLAIFKVFNILPKANSRIKFFDLTLSDLKQKAYEGI